MTTFERAFLVLNALCLRGVRHMLLSPGSRNAPFMLALSHFPEIAVTLQPDERSAAYTAMGVAQATNRPVVVCCTSGTAAANYLPAVVEAHYMRIPLVLLTADRPADAVDQRRGQTIRQPSLFGDYPKQSVCFTDDSLDDTLLQHIAFCANDGPIHINLPLREPLYETSAVERTAITAPASTKKTLAAVPSEAISFIGQSKRILLLVGQMEPNAALQEELAHWKAAGVMVAAEATANISADLAMQHVDRWCRDADFAPDLLVSVGRDWVSKAIKNRFECPIIHVEDTASAPNAFGEVRVHLHTGAVEGLSMLRRYVANQDTAYSERWYRADKERQEAIGSRSFPWSDFTAIRQCMQSIHDDEFLHLGNSSAVRYGLLSPRGNYPVFSNRGTAGIDGSLSASVGQAIGLKRRGWCVMGDVSFFYDHNALWIGHPQCTPVVINNGGGHIFQLIDGPNKQPHIAEWQQSPSSMSIEHISGAFGFVHHLVQDEAGLMSAMQSVRDSSEKCVIEIVTDVRNSIDAWKKLHGDSL